MGSKPTPSKAMLDSICRYDQDTGRLFWKERPKEMFADNASGHSQRHNADKWNAKCAGKEAFTAVKGDGYRHGAIGGKFYSAHRIIWKLMTGEEPQEVDHINGVRTDNRWSNLRSVPRSVNLKNKARLARNMSGANGVRKNRDGWQAFITNNYKMTCLGTFKTKEEAIAARKAAELKCGFHTNHGRDLIETNPAA